MNSLNKFLKRPMKLKSEDYDIIFEMEKVKELKLK